MPLRTGSNLHNDHGAHSPSARNSLTWPQHPLGPGMAALNHAADAQESSNWPAGRPESAAPEAPSGFAAHRKMLPPARAHSNEEFSKPLPRHFQPTWRNGIGAALTDTPATTAPNSPNLAAQQQHGSTDKMIRPRPTTLDIPGLTRSRASPDGKIAKQDVGSKLIIIMVGLPARGKSYITKKMARYLNWLQHDTKIFNVGERRRVAAGSVLSPDLPPKLAAGLEDVMARARISRAGNGSEGVSPSRVAAEILINGEHANGAADAGRSRSILSKGTAHNLPEILLPEPAQSPTPPPESNQSHAEPMDQSAGFFDPSNKRAAQLREQVAIDTLDDLLDYILLQNGSVGILDATNSTLERRQVLMRKIRARAGPDVNVLFLESLCVDEQLLERNMSLKLSGPDYKGKDGRASLADFKKRVAMYEKAYVPLGEYEEAHNMAYVQMIDVGRKVISHQIRGFLSAQAVYYLLNFHLAPRQIWLTRHGQSTDNVNGKIGGDSELSPLGIRYARALTAFVSAERKAWDVRQRDKEANSRLPPGPGDATPPNPQVASDNAQHKNFCVWTSMLKRSVQTAQFFDEDDFDNKQMRMLDELNGGYMEGLTYEQIKTQFRDEYELRRKDKLYYRYPGPGGEGYLDVINRLRPVIVELERMTDHVLLIGHRSVTRVLLAYFQGLKREAVADLDVPLGFLYCLEPKPYGVDFRAYRFDPDRESFELDPLHRLRRASSHYE